MQWHRGAIHEAISAAKTNKKIFMVYIEGTDDASNTMSEVFNNVAVVEALSEDCVPIKLEANSVEYRQFQQIYPILMVPSTFFIGVSGVPLEVATGALEQKEFIAKIQNAKLLHQQQQIVQCSRENTTPSQAANSTNQPSVNRNEASNEIANSVSESGSETLDSSSSGASLEEKLERAKELLAEKKVQRMKEEQENEKKKELEYRKMGKEMQKAKAMREQKEMEQWAKSQKKEKEDERLAREKVRQQIAQDRAEQAARFVAEPRKVRDTTQVQQESSEFRGNRVRIQVRFPDGTSITKEFPVTATLEDVRTFIMNHANPTLSRFSLATSFPRRQFQQSDYSQTLVDLGLAPSAVLLLVPEKSGAISGPHGQTLWAFLAMVFSPVTSLWTYVMSFFSRRRPNTSSTHDSRVPESRESNAAQGTAEQASTRRRMDASGSSVPYRREGNIHRFANDGTDTDDENNTWNGNSTQQL